MRNYGNDPILKDGLIFDMHFNHPMTDLLAGGGTTYVFDRGPNRIQATCVSFVAGTWAIETPGITPLMTIDLDGGADYVNLGTGSYFDDIATTNAVTFEVACLPDAVGVEMLMAGWSSGIGGNPSYPILFIEASGYVEFRPTQDSGETSECITDVDITGSTHHIIATFDETDNIAKVLVDGGNTDEATVTISCSNDTIPTLGAQNFYIGCRYNTNSSTEEGFYDGHIYWARMWDRRLTHREQMLLYERAKIVLGL